ncbi:hypothetical protein NPIL_366441 [Nephila pilipes]|uniref:Uncharacterized protein n=1 Tax=Nephila pilipes TaxID=299642 RepID=A0A8X6U6R9_NEPPI|nr:hypothetical protein NPIL_366441 [Nephila pilipes]
MKFHELHRSSFSSLHFFFPINKAPNNRHIVARARFLSPNCNQRFAHGLHVNVERGGAISRSFRPPIGYIMTTAVKPKVAVPLH